jgi:hypothetical protein
MNFDTSRSYFKDGSQIRIKRLLDWPPCGADLNKIENVRVETKHVMAENWPDPSTASKNALWDVVLDAWEEVAHSEVYAATLVESLPWRMQW